MGNQQSNNINNNAKEEKLNPEQLIEYIASNYILTLDFQSLTKLNEKEYCDNLVVLTSNIIGKYFNPLEISYLAQRIKNGEEVNEIEKDKILFFNKNTLDKHELNSLKKKRICNSIAKFYIKIAHVFATILMTINPVYIYKNNQGEIIKTPSYNKKEIPSNYPHKIIKMNICEERIKSLSNGKDDLIHPTICSLNNKETLMDEPGIPELNQLYFDDNFDDVNGKFQKMSEQSKKDYEKDLLIFYNVFTGKQDKVLPPEIKSFNDIKLKSYQECKEKKQYLNQTIKVPVTNKLFAQYAENIKNMVKNANDNQKSLLDIINKLFVYSENYKEIRINPSLNEENLQKLVEDTRNLIMKLYLTCEIDYTNGIKIYEALIEEKILETSQNQIDYLNKLSDSLREI